MPRFRKTLVISGLALGLLAVASMLWREALVELAARRLLSAGGIENARLDVVEVGASGLVIKDLSLGAGLPGARRVRLDYTLRGLLSGRLGTLTIEGITYAAPPEPQAALAPLGDLAGRGGGGWYTLSRVEIANAVITLGPPLEGSIAIDGALDLSGETPGADLDVALQAGPASGALTLRSEALGEGGAVEITGGGEAKLAGLALPGAPGAAATGGSAILTLEGSVRIPALDAGWAALRAEGLASLNGVLRLSGVTTSLAPGVLSGDVGWSLGAGGGSLRLGLPRPAHVTLAGLSPDSLATLGLSASAGAAYALEAALSSEGTLVAWSRRPEGGAMDLSADLALSLGDARVVAGMTARAETDAGWTFAEPVRGTLELRASELGLAALGGAARLRQTEWSASGSVGRDGAVALEGPMAVELQNVRLDAFRAGRLSAKGSVRLAGRPGRWSVAAAPGLAVAAEEAAVPGRLDFATPLRLALESFALESADGAPRVDLLVLASPAAGTLRGSAGEISTFAEAAGRVGLAATLGGRVDGKVTLEDASLSLPGYDIDLAGLTGSFPVGSVANPTELALAGEAHGTSHPARFAPVGFSLDGQRRGDAITFSGVAKMLRGAVTLPLEGSADLAEMTGRVRVGPGRIAFRKGDLQPSALSSRLSALGEVAGAARVNADVLLEPEGSLRSSASLAFEDLSARVGEMEVAGLAGRLALGRLSPLATAGPQELTARSATLGVPVGQPRVRFTAEARGEGVRIRIHEATGKLAGGTVAVKEARWDSAARINAFEVQVRDVAIGQLLSEWQIAGISGSGRLSGVIPVRLEPQGIVIADGSLDAQGPGVIRVDWGSARETLMGSGEQVALTVRALEDFHYESLSIGVQQSAERALSLAVGLEGANPDVLDGYPFRFNITLSGELAPILEAVREGRRIGAGLLRGGLGAGR